MKQSNFKFSKPFVSKIDYSINKNFNFDNTLSVSNVFEVSISRDEKDSKAMVDLGICIGEKDFDEAKPFYIDMIISAVFSWDESCYDEDTLNSLLSINAPALLLGYARPLIATITNMSPFPTYNLPFYNFT